MQYPHSYLDEVRQLAIAKGVDPDKVQEDIVSVAIQTAWSTEDIARSFVMACEAYMSMKQLEASMEKIQHMAGHTQKEVNEISQALVELPAKKTASKMPYYHKNKMQWWK